MGGDPHHYQLFMLAPQLSLRPWTMSVSAPPWSFPLDFAATHRHRRSWRPMPGPAVREPDRRRRRTPRRVGLQQAYGWAFQADPKITVSYTYH